MLDALDALFDEADAERYTMERSLEISSTEMLELHDVLRQQARRDALTGLPNRAALIERTTEMLAQGQPIALLFVDLDGFKAVNDTLGHAAGDELLVLVSNRIRDLLRPEDVLARLGGDEFIVVLPAVEDPGLPSRLAQMIVERTDTPFEIAGHEVRIGASIGVVGPAGAGATPAGLLGDADIAMYQAKLRGRSQFVEFDGDMREALERSLSLEAALNEAVGREEFVLHYQPIVEVAGGRVCSMEALIRWQRPGHGLVMPGAFVEAAERCGVISRISAWVVAAACREAAGWREADRTVSVNLSAHDLARPDVVDMIAEALRAAGLPGRRLTIEITESTLLARDPLVSQNMAGLRGLGVSLAIDDFGVGYSSLSYLQELPVQLLKIDRSFVAGIDVDPRAEAIVRAVLVMADALGLSAVAEGVERAAQHDALRGLGCEFAQGYLYGRPAPRPLETAPSVGVPGPRGSRLPAV